MSVVPPGFIGTRRVQDHGGSKQVVIPAELADRLGIEEGDDLMIRCEDDELILTPNDG